MLETKLNLILVKSVQYHMQDIEVGKRHGNKFQSGYPDIEGCYKGLGFYIEGKKGSWPKRDTTPIMASRDLKTNQVARLEKFAACGALCYVAVYIMEGMQKFVLFVKVGSPQYEMIKDGTFNLKNLSDWIYSNSCYYTKQLFDVKDYLTSEFQAHADEVKELW